MTIYSSKYNGVCNGVKRSLMLLDKASGTGNPVFLTDQIVHNNLISQEYEKRGVKYLTSDIDINTLPKDSVIVISAHGFPISKIETLKKYNFEIIDTTCPIVKLRSEAIQKQVEKNDVVLLFVKSREHIEVKFLTNNFSFPNLITISESNELKEFIKNYKEKLDKIYVHTQTTFQKVKEREFIDLLKENFNSVELLSSICPNCLERQEDVRKNIDTFDALIVVGSAHSSNANELKKIADKRGKKAFVVESVETIPSDIYDCENIFIISSASSTEETFKSILNCLSKNK